MSSKHQRIEHANKLLQAIAAHGRRFFRNDRDGQVAYFVLAIDGKLYYVDEHTKKRIYVVYRWRWRNFSGGGTLESLVRALTKYIRTGERINSGYFGPWEDWRACGDGDMWGYGLDEMRKVRESLKDSDCIAHKIASADSVAA